MFVFILLFIFWKWKTNNIDRERERGETEKRERPKQSEIRKKRRKGEKYWFLKDLGKVCLHFVFYILKIERNSIEREREREREGQKESKIRKKEKKGGNNGIPECVQLPFESVNLGESLGFCTSLSAVDSFRVQASYFVERSTIWMCHVRFMRCTLDRNCIEGMCISQCVVVGGMWHQDLFWDCWGELGSFSDDEVYFSPFLVSALRGNTEKIMKVMSQDL